MLTLLQKLYNFVCFRRKAVIKIKKFKIFLKIYFDIKKEKREEKKNTKEDLIYEKKDLEKLTAKEDNVESS